MSGHSTQDSWTSTHLSPVRAAAAATCRVWFDCTPPIETSVSQPCASASATRYSSFRILLPPNARRELQSSRLAQSEAPRSSSVSRSSRGSGGAPEGGGYRWNRGIHGAAAAGSAVAEVATAPTILHAYTSSRRSCG